MTYRSANFTPEANNILRDKVGQVSILACVPNLLRRIKLRRISRQPLNLDSSGQSPAKSSSPTSVNWPAIHDQYKTMGQMTKQPTNESFKIIGANIMLLQVKIQTQAMLFRRNSNRRDSRKPVMSGPIIQQRCLSPWCPSTTDQRLEHKAAFIRENDTTTGSLGFFLYLTSLSCATWRWLSRRVPELVVRVFGNSSPWPLRSARPAKGDSGRKSFCGLPRPLAIVSTSWCDSREQPGLFSTDGLTVDALCRKALVGDLVVACFSGLSCHLVCRHPATSLQSRHERQPFWPLRRFHDRRSTMRWHGDGGVPVLALFLSVSCIILSEHRQFFLYFFKEQ